MQSVSRSRLVPEPPPIVWGWLSDFPAISSWATQVTHSAPLTTSATGPGAVRRVQVGRDALREQVVGWDPPHRLSYTVEGLPKVVRHVTTTWTLAAEGTGTRVTVTSQVSTKPPFLARAVGRRLGAAAERLLADLSAHSPAAEVLR